MLLSSSSLVLGGQHRDLPGGRHAVYGALTFQPAILVQGIMPGSPAIDSGLLPGDQIVKVDGQVIAGKEASGAEPIDGFRKMLSVRAGQNTVTLRVSRDEGVELDLVLRMKR